MSSSAAATTSSAAATTSNAAVRRSFFSKQGAPDIHFEFGDANGQRKQIAAHKKLLSEISPVFRAMFNGDWNETSRAVIVDASYSSFNEFIEYFYTLNVNLDDDNISELLYIGHKYNVEDFESRCENYLAERVTVDNLFESLGCAGTYNLEILEDTCKTIMTYNTELVIKSNGCRDGSATLLMQILEMASTIYNDNEGIFHACIEWAKHKCRQSNEDDSNAQNIREKLNACFQYTQFDKMRPEVFIQCARAYEGLFTAEEMHNTITQAGWLLQHNHQHRFWFKAQPTGRIKERAGYEAFHMHVSKSMFLRAIEIGKLVDDSGKPVANYHEVLGVTVLRFQTLPDSTINRRTTAVIQCQYTFKVEDDKVIIDLFAESVLLRPKFIYAILVYTDNWDKYSYATFEAKNHKMHNVSLTFDLSNRMETIVSGIHLEARSGSSWRPAKWKNASSLMDDSDSENDNDNDINDN